MEDSFRSAPLLASGKPTDNWLMQSEPPLRVVPAANRPRPEIILRWKRFALLVLLSAVLISAFTVTLWRGIPLKKVRSDDAESQVELFNTYSGVVMGFFESFVSLLLGYLFPVFIVYLHNLKWSRQDDPASKPISKIKKTALMLFFPIVMIAIGNSLSAVQTNQSGGESESLQTRTRRLVQRETTMLELTALRSVVREVETAESIGEDPLNLKRVATGTRVSLGFPLRDWSDDFAWTNALNGDGDASPTVRIPWTQRGDQELTQRASQVFSAATTRDLALHGATALAKLAKEVSLTKAPLYGLSERSGLSDVVEAVGKVFWPVRSVNSSGIAVRFHKRKFHPVVSLETLTVEVPIATVNASSLSCGAAKCVSTSTDPLVRLRSTVAASQYLPSCWSEDFTNCAVDKNALFIFGSTISASTTPTGSISYSLSLTFAKLSWSFHRTYTMLCERDEEDPSCDGLSIHLGRSFKHLLLTAMQVPSDQLHLPSSPLPLVQIAQPPVIVSNQLASVTIVQSADSKREPDSSTVDQFSNFMQANRFVLDGESTARTVEAAAMLFLFQNALVTPAASNTQVAWQRHLAAAATTKEFQVYMANTSFGAIATWIACGILFILSALVLVFPNARARLEPPKGGNARAERFIAVQTEEVYPNLIYKKRFRIGKTGEKIKFREFAVESVTLHHKMEEDEQIDL